MNMENTKNRLDNSGLYEFSQDGNSCIIKEPRTPRYWYNYLWNENRYCGMKEGLAELREKAQER